MSTAEIASDVRPPFARVLELLMGKLVSQAICAAVELGLPDALDDRPRTARELAATLGVKSADSIHRLLRALATAGVFRAVPPDAFEHNDLSRAMKRGAPGGVDATSRMVASRWHVAAWESLVRAVQSGTSGFEIAFGDPLFTHLAGHPEAASVFVKTMAEIANLEDPAIVAAYDFALHRRVVDVGGGDGSLLVRVLRASAARGVLSDRPTALSAAKVRFETEGMQDRCDLLEGDFFEAVPPGADCYILKHVLHDWDDERVLRILTSCRRAAAPGAHLLVVEHLLSPHGEPSFAALLDLDMLVLTGGRERTEAQFRELLAKAGFAVDRVLDTAASVKVIVAITS